MSNSRFMPPWGSPQGGGGPTTISMFPHLRAVPPPPMVTPGQTSTARIPAFQPVFPILQQSPPIGRPSYSQRGRSPAAVRGRGSGPRQGRGGRGGGRFNAPTNPQSPKGPQAPAKLICEVCDRAFLGPKELAEHEAQHVVCGREGCTFKAHPKVVAKHVEMQHDTGLYKRMVLGTTPEEVNKWREERKRRFPTRANIEQQRTAAAERTKRGERLCPPRGRFPRRGGWNSHPQLPPNLPPRKPAPGPESTPQPPAALPTVLASLVTAYGSDSDEDAAPKEESVGRELEGPPVPEKRARVAPTVTPPVRRQPTVRQQWAVRRRPPTLLQKLLTSEIRHERNVILQCVRYVVHNDFFDSK